jgi:hypothetical protein
MLRASRPLADGASQRRSLVRRFAQLDGWQRGENKKFDAFVEHKRKEREFEEFDQRVERAYLLALKDHKAEIWNGVKRKLARTNTKYTPTVLMETNRAIDERSRWLRDVFAQIDSDYRSNDETRQATAAADLTKALRSSSSDFMAHAYDQKAQQRRMGEKEKMQMEAELAADELPDISEDEANRYANLKPRMASIEAALKEKYGLAGHRHWEQLQSIKDAEYVDKLDRAAEKYKELLAQHDAYEESTESHASKRLIARIHEGQVRFQTAMELEEERLKLIDAKESMDKERYEEQKQRRRAALLRAADWRDEGMSEAAIAQRLKQETFDRIVQGYAAKGAQQKDTTVAKKKAFLTIVDEMEARFEADDGTRAMQDGSQRKMSSDAKQELDKILSEADTLARDRAHAAAVEKEERAAAAQKEETARHGSGERPQSARKEARSVGYRQRGHVERSLPGGAPGPPRRTRDVLSRLRAHAALESAPRPQASHEAGRQLERQLQPIRQDLQAPGRGVHGVRLGHEQDVDPQPGRRPQELVRAGRRRLRAQGQGDGPDRHVLRAQGRPRPALDRPALLQAGHPRGHEQGGERDARGLPEGQCTAVDSAVGNGGPRATGVTT